MVRMIRRSQIDSSDGALVRGWIADYTAGLNKHAGEGMRITAWMQAFGEYGVAHWIFDAPDLATLDEFLSTHAQHDDMREILKRGSTRFMTGYTRDLLLKEIPAPVASAGPRSIQKRVRSSALSMMAPPTSSPTR